MGRIGYGYGSEWHLLRWMGRHCIEFNKIILEKIGGAGQIEWSDFDWKSEPPFDREIVGVEFLPMGPPRNRWKDFWPSSRRSQNWDAIGKRLRKNGGREWLLVEAKAHIGELASNCAASEKGGRQRIRDAFLEVKTKLGVSSEHDWLTGYYQYANRLAALHFLHTHSQPARLIFVYFFGDKSGPRRNCPQKAEDWNDALALQKAHLGLARDHPLAPFVHELFLRVGKATHS